MSCPVCELPPEQGGEQFLFIWPPHGHTLYKLASWLSERQTAFENLVRDNCVRLVTDDASRMLREIGATLSRMERDDTRVLVTPEREPGLGEFGRVSSFARAVEIADGAWVLDLLREERYRSFAQPIVAAHQGFPVSGHEMLLRAHDRDGTEILPGRLFEAARDPQTFFNLDRAARLSAVTASRHLDEELDVFVNFMPGSIYNPGVCLRTTVDKVVELGIDPGRVVFEVVESDSIRDLDHLASIVDFYRSAGFRIALDDFGTGANNLSTLMALKPDLIKLDKSLLPEDANDRRRQGLVQAVVTDCHENGIEVVAEGVETEEQRDLVAGAGVDRMQGHLFGRARAVG